MDDVVTRQLREACGRGGVMGRQELEACRGELAGLEEVKSGRATAEAALTEVKERLAAALATEAPGASRGSSLCRRRARQPQEASVEVSRSLEAWGEQGMTRAELAGIPTGRAQCVACGSANLNPGGNSVTKALAIVDRRTLRNACVSFGPINQGAR